MTQVLHQADEETDVGSYGAYLRAQSDDDLLDIVRHLDPDRYPARLDAAQREARRRQVLHVSVYTPTEYTLRCFAIGALMLSALTLALTCVLTPEAASGPSWPTGEMMPDDMRVSQIMALFATAILRAVVVWGVRLGLYAIGMLVLGYWTVSGAFRLRRRRARADVWRLCATAWALLAVAMMVASGPGSAIPILFHSSSGAERGLTLLDPRAW